MTSRSKQVALAKQVAEVERIAKEEANAQRKPLKKKAPVATSSQGKKKRRAKAPDELSYTDKMPVIAPKNMTELLEGFDTYVQKTVAVNSSNSENFKSARTMCRLILCQMAWSEDRRASLPTNSSVRTKDLDMEQCSFVSKVDRTFVNATYLDKSKRSMETAEYLSVCRDTFGEDFGEGEYAYFDRYGMPTKANEQTTGVAACHIATATPKTPLGSVELTVNVALARLSQDGHPVFARCISDAIVESYTYTFPGSSLYNSQTDVTVYHPQAHRFVYMKMLQTLKCMVNKLDAKEVRLPNPLRMMTHFITAARYSSHILTAFGVGLNMYTTKKKTQRVSTHSRTGVPGTEKKAQYLKKLSRRKSIAMISREVLHNPSVGVEELSERVLCVLGLNKKPTPEAKAKRKRRAKDLVRIFSKLGTPLAAQIVMTKLDDIDDMFPLQHGESIYPDDMPVSADSFCQSFGSSFLTMHRKIMEEVKPGMEKTAKDYFEQRETDINHRMAALKAELAQGRAAIAQVERNTKNMNHSADLERQIEEKHKENEALRLQIIELENRLKTPTIDSCVGTSDCQGSQCFTSSGAESEKRDKLKNIGPNNASKHLNMATSGLNSKTRLLMRRIFNASMSKPTINKAEKIIELVAEGRVSGKSLSKNQMKRVSRAKTQSKIRMLRKQLREQMKKLNTIPESSESHSP